MTTKLPAIARPNGKLYRPRLLTARLLGDEEELTAVVVFGTHDPNAARPVAEKALAEFTKEWGEGQLEAVLLEGNELVWLREQLTSIDEDGRRCYYETDPERGRAGVRWGVEERDVPIAAEIAGGA